MLKIYPTNPEETKNGKPPQKEIRKIAQHNKAELTPHVSGTTLNMYALNAPVKTYGQTE